jgi:hypothetical protein
MGSGGASLEWLDVIYFSPEVLLVLLPLLLLESVLLCLCIRTDSGFLSFIPCGSPVYMHDNVLIMPTSPSQFSGGDTSYESGMIFQGQIELEHVPDDHIDIESNDSSNEDTLRTPRLV